MKEGKIFLFFLLLFFFSPFLVWAKGEETLKGRVIKVWEEKIVGENNEQTRKQSLLIKILSGSKKGETISLEVEEELLPGHRPLRKNDLVLLTLSKDENGRDVYYLSDFVRTGPLLFLLVVFVVLVLVIGGWQGLTSLLGLGISFLVVVFFLIPQLSLGRSPILIATITSFLIIPVTFYPSHGFNRKTTVAIGGTLVSLLFTIFLSSLMIDAAKLSGFVSEEAGFLQAIKPGKFNWPGLLLAGMIVGVLGVLDDVTVSQAAVVQQLWETNPQLSSQEIFLRAMKIGKDHIASMVNTLILVYAGAALPLLLLFYQNPHPLGEIINYEIVAEEIVRMLTGSIGLILAVPLTTLLAVHFFKKGN